MAAVKSNAPAFGRERGATERSGIYKGGKQTAACFKCGKKGHWARDCTASPAEMEDHRRAMADKPPDDATPAAAPDAADAPAAKAKAVRVPRKRPKLTADGLSAAMRTAVETIPAAFGRVYKGPGHEPGDLLRLLDLYRKWHVGVFPAVGFGDFVDRLESLGATRQVQSALSAMRDRALNGGEGGGDGDAAAGPPPPDGHVAGEYGGTAGGDAAARLRDMDDDDDDDVGGARPPPPATLAPPGGLALAEEDDPPQDWDRADGQGGEGGAPGMNDDDDDHDEAERLLMAEDIAEEQAEQAAARAAAVAGTGDARAAAEAGGDELAVR